MQFGAGLSRRSDSGAALEESLGGALRGLDSKPDVLFMFGSPHHSWAAEVLAKELASAVAAHGTSLGCIAEGVIGGREEADTTEGLAVWAAAMPGVDWVSSHLEAVPTTGGVAVRGWEAPDDTVGVILVADPFTFPTAPFVARFGEMGLPVVGGLANSMLGPGEAVLIRNGKVYGQGAIALALGGNLEFRTVVSQGCRPLGSPVVVTEADGNELQRLGAGSAYAYLEELVTGLPPQEQALARTGLQIGIVADEYRSEYRRGDFLIRGVVGIDEDHGTVTVGESVPVGRIVQFQVRDPESADEDLRMMLGGESAEGGVLLFSCNGRGSRFFGTPDHDAGLVDELLKPPAVAGFFAAGEVGPVGGGNFVHGYTASMVELRPFDG